MMLMTLSLLSLLLPFCCPTLFPFLPCVRLVATALARRCQH